jgi:membrane associated rhomboid family serine protease
MNGPLAWCTLLLIAVTCAVSYAGFLKPAVVRRYIFNPESILADKEYYRLVTAAFLHADGRHLFFNMLSLFLFGSTLELVFGQAEFLAIYFGAVVGGSLLSLYVHRHHQYLAYGASGGVCGILFAYILLFPGANIVAFMFPVPVPGWLYAIGYMLVSFYGLKENRGNVGHDAHLGGAVIGFLIAAGMNPDAVRAHVGVFLAVLGLAVALLIYLWMNPMFLPLSAFLERPKRWRQPPTGMPKHRRESLQVDAILEKISQRGFESLTAEEKAVLGEVSGKYRRRAESKKPDSGLAI